jgi:hypothetical protein
MAMRHFRRISAQILTWTRRTIRTIEVMSSNSSPISKADRPGRVLKLNGVIVQSDKTSWLGAWIIRPVEIVDLHLAGIGREIGLASDATLTEKFVL